VSGGRLWATSDLHVAYQENRDILTERLVPRSPDDWLIVAGDVGETAGDVEWALGVLAAPGARVEVGLLSAVVVAALLPPVPWPVLAVATYVPAVLLVARGHGEGLTFLLIVAVSALVLRCDDRWARLVLGTVAVAVPPVLQLVAPTEWGWPFWTGGILVSWLSAEQLRRYRALVEQLRATRERLAEQAVQLERRRIAAELHDLVGHSLGVLLLHVTGARRRIPDDPGGATEALLRAESIGRSGLAEIRRGVAALRTGTDTALVPASTAADVPDLVASTAAAGCPVTLTVTGELSAVEPLTGLAVYRVVQESLANAARHAAGAAVSVALTVGPGAVEVCVRDRGGPPGPRGPAGVGLVGMRERVQAMGGTFEAGPTGGGWQVRAVLPGVGG